jgi:hypothetical protein
MGWMRSLERGFRHWLGRSGFKSDPELRDRMETQMMLQAGLLARHDALLPEDTPIQETEFKCFSQNGEDGILQFLTGKLKVRERIFVEFGVQDYQESNTRLLLLKDGWSGLVMDGSARNVEAIRKSRWFPNRNLQARCAWITRENIDALLASAGVEGPIGVLSIDIDGNDYWVWEAVTVVDPVIVICEYNNFFGPDRAVTIPYAPSFQWDGGQYSGASIQALCRLAERKGYAFLGSDQAGVNAFFVRKDRLGGLRVGDPAADFRRACHRGGRNPADRSRTLERREGLEAMADRELLDLDTGARGPVREILACEFSRVWEPWR